MKYHKKERSGRSWGILLSEERKLRQKEKYYTLFNIKIGEGYYFGNKYRLLNHQQITFKLWYVMYLEKQFNLNVYSKRPENFQQLFE